MNAPAREHAALEAEQSVLGARLHHGADVPGDWDVSADDFGEAPHHSLVARAIEVCARRGAVDPITVLDELERGGHAEACGGLAGLNALAFSLPSAALVSVHAAIVRRNAAERRSTHKRARLAALANGPSSALEILPELRALIDELDPESTAAPARFPLFTPVALASLPRARQRIHGVLPETGCAAVFGPSGSAKSFIVVGMLAAIGEGESWFGHRARRGRCVYVVLEGQAGVPRRVAAWEEVNGRPFPPSALFMFEAFRLTERADVLDLAAAIDAAGGADVVFIDTLNRAAPEADENSSQDMGRILEGARELQACTGGLVGLVHHSGKDAARGMRGHSSLFAALDAAIEVSRADDRREWKVSKSKDGEDGAVFPFSLRVVHLGEDEAGDPITSCVAVDLAGDDTASQAPRARPPRGGNQRIVFDALGPLLRESDAFGRGGAPAVRPCVLLEDVVVGTRGRLACEPKRHAERARAAITGLLASGVLGSGEGWLWLR